MRVRIKDYAEHCDFYVGNEHYDKTYEEKQVLWLEKFAELIVRECQFAIVSRTDLPKHERKLYNDVLKEHFGVEE